MKLAYCGDYCNDCPRYIAILSGSEEKLRETAFLMKFTERWKKYGQDLIKNQKFIKKNGIEVFNKKMKEKVEV